MRKDIKLIRLSGILSTATGRREPGAVSVFKPASASHFQVLIEFVRSTSNRTAESGYSDMYYLLAVVPAVATPILRNFSRACSASLLRG
jgi:hypothetical protein